MKTAKIAALCLSVAIAFGSQTNARAATLPDITGTWFANGNSGARCTITQTGSTLFLTNQQGSRATGSFVDSGTITADWPYVGGMHLTGTISPNLQRITWSNGSYWSRSFTPIVRPTPVPTPPPQPPSGPNTLDVCKGAVPAGWVVTADDWKPTRCGNPTSIVYNVWTIVRLSSIPVGGTLTICQGYAPIPSNWVTVNSTWMPTRCGRPNQIINNVATIKRVS